MKVKHKLTADFLRNQLKDQLKDDAKLEDFEVEIEVEGIEQKDPTWEEIQEKFKDNITATIKDAEANFGKSDEAKAQLERMTKLETQNKELSSKVTHLTRSSLASKYNISEAKRSDWELFIEAKAAKSEKTFEEIAATDSKTFANSNPNTGFNPSLGGDDSSVITEKALDDAFGLPSSTK